MREMLVEPGLRGDRLVAVLVDLNPRFPALCRYNEQLVKLPKVTAWAREQLQRGETFLVWRRD